MKEFIEKLIERLKGRKTHLMKDFVLANVVFSSKQKALDRINEIDGVIEIINQLVEEYINTSTDTSSDTSTTNADRIRSMDDEELAEFLGGIDHTIDDCEFIVKIGDEWLHDSTADILDWLQSEVEGVTQNE